MGFHTWQKTTQLPFSPCGFTTCGVQTQLKTQWNRDVGAGAVTTDTTEGFYGTHCVFKMSSWTKGGLGVPVLSFGSDSQINIICVERLVAFSSPPVATHFISLWLNQILLKLCWESVDPPLHHYHINSPQWRLFQFKLWCLQCSHWVKLLFSSRTQTPPPPCWEPETTSNYSLDRQSTVTILSLIDDVNSTRTPFRTSPICVPVLAQRWHPSSRKQPKLELWLLMGEQWVHVQAGGPGFFRLYWLWIQETVELTGEPSELITGMGRDTF